MIIQKYSNRMVAFMKTLFLALITVYFAGSCDAQISQDLAAQNNDLDTNKVLVSEAKHYKVNKIITKILARYHYKKTVIDDSLSAIIFDNFIQGLDNNKLYFLQSDIDSFETLKYKFDDYIIAGELDPAYGIYNTYKKSFNERIKWILNTINDEFDYTIDEDYEPFRKNAEWAKTYKELEELWRKRLKNESLNLKLNAKEKDKIVEIISNRYQNYQKAILQTNSEDVFQLYMNAFGEAVDPHTNYLSPRTSENFSIQMKLSYGGIGARLQNQNDYTTVTEIIPGGPAFRGSQLKKDDKIIGVAQGKDGEMVDVIGWRIDNVVDLIRGEKGTEVKLAILPAEGGLDSKPDTIKIIRDKVKLEEQSAQKKIISLNEDGINYKIGVIELPAFYIDFEAKRKGDIDYKSTTRDVKLLLEELKTEQIDGIIIDLRGNGGGSLQEAIDLTGLFIESGPVVQVKNSNGSIDVGEDLNSSIIYDGPLAVMVNNFSASASEIFSAAIQDYGRGLVIGAQTFGKGTVQNLIDLNRFVPTTNEKLGQLKLTIAKYYRINGSSTQHLGVVPDVKFPSAYPQNKYGESSQATALKWDQIETTEFEKYDDLAQFIPLLLEKHNERMNKEPELQFLLEDIEDIRTIRNKKSYSLMESKRKSEREESEAKRNARDEERQRSADLRIEDLEEVVAETIDIDDPLLAESGRILADLIQFSIDSNLKIGRIKK
jgi:carboxyl-terminal processing protease